MDTPNNHYRDCVIEPIKVIKAMLTHEQYLGYLLGNVIKYRFRNGHKTDGDLEKAMQYETWYKEERQNEKVKLPAAPTLEERQKEEVKLPAAPTLFDVVHITMPEIEHYGCGCPHDPKFTPAFKAAGYIQPPDFDCSNMFCRECWARKAEAELVSEPLPVNKKAEPTIRELMIQAGVDTKSTYGCPAWFVKQNIEPHLRFCTEHYGCNSEHVCADQTVQEMIAHLGLYPSTLNEIYHEKYHEDYPITPGGVPVGCLRDRLSGLLPASLVRKLVNFCSGHSCQECTPFLKKTIGELEKQLDGYGDEVDEEDEE